MNCYGRSKLAGEVAVRDEISDHMMVRSAWLYSPFGSSFVSTMLGLAASRGEITVIDDQYGNPTSALHLAEGLLEVLVVWRAGDRTGLGQAYHLAAEGDARWRDFAQRIFAVSRAHNGPAATVTAVASRDWPAPMISNWSNVSRYGPAFWREAPQASLEIVQGRRGGSPSPGSLSRATLSPREGCTGLAWRQPRLTRSR